jgi:hypothetical protein
MDFCFDSSAREDFKGRARLRGKPSAGESKGARPAVGLVTSQPNFAAIDRHTIAARLVVAGQTRVLRGRGHYQDDPELGPVLRIVVADATGDFELVLSEAQWTGSVEPGHALGCDYLVHL